MAKEQLFFFLLSVNHTPLVFRDSLVLPEYISFGNEIEVNGIDLKNAEEDVAYFNAIHQLKDNYGFIAKKDETVDAEITTPILHNSKSKWSLFYDMYTLLNETGAQIDDNTSCHVHYGTHMINTPQKLALLLKTLVVFEPIIFKFGYGEENRPREAIRYAPDQAIFSLMMTPQRVRKFVDVLESYNFKNPGLMHAAFKTFLAEDLHSRPVFNFMNFDFTKLQYGISFDEPREDDHLEVRCNNGTLKPEIAQNYINLVAHILWAVNEGKIDEAYVEKEYAKYRKKRYHFDTPYMIIVNEEEGMRYNRLLDGFDTIRLDKALKLADMIFETEIDKVYFLKQYLKLFEVSEEYVHGLFK